MTAPLSPSDLAEIEAVAKVARWPLCVTECHEELSRGGELQPCDKVAVAVRIEPEEDAPYPVCAFHARGEMVPLAHIARMDPATTLALLADLARARDAVARVRELLDAAEAHRGSYAFSMFTDNDDEPPTALIGTKAVRAALDADAAAGGAG